MPIQILSERESVEKIVYYHSYEWVDTPGAGFSFECDEDGTVSESLRDLAKSNLDMCLKGHDEDGRRIISKGVQKHIFIDVESRVGLCVCGSEVFLESFTNSCDQCHRLYNRSGYDLTDPSGWGEETGEHPSDIPRIW